MKPSGPVSSFIPREARAGQAYLPPVVQSADHVEMSVCVWRDSRLVCRTVVMLRCDRSLWSGLQSEAGLSWLGAAQEGWMLPCCYHGDRA